LCSWPMSVRRDEWDAWKAAIDEFVCGKQGRCRGRLQHPRSKLRHRINIVNTRGRITQVNIPNRCGKSVQIACSKLHYDQEYTTEHPPKYQQPRKVMSNIYQERGPKNSPLANFMRVQAVPSQPSDDTLLPHQSRLTLPEY